MTVTTPARSGRPAAPAAPGRRPAHRRDVQGLRAVAVLAVLVGHTLAVAGVGADGSGPLGALARLAAGGLAGVDVFFVISGFVITTMLVERTDGTMLDFLLRRVRRIAPASLAVLAVLVLVAWRAYPGPDAGGVLADVRAALLLSENWWLAHQSADYAALGGSASPVEHFWSLSVEEQWYLAAPLVLYGLWRLLGARRGRVRPRAATAVVVLVPTLAGSLLAAALTEPGPARYFLTQARVWELAAGAALAAGLLARPRGGPLPRPAAHASALAGWALLGWGLWLAPAAVAAGTWPGPATIPTVAGTVLLVLAGSGSAPLSRDGAVVPATAALHGPVARWVGDRSYSLYLWHWPLLVVPAAVLGAPLPRWALPVQVAAAFVVAALSYRFVEQPFQSAGRRGGRRAAPGGSAAQLLRWPVLVPALASVAVLAGTTLSPVHVATWSVPDRSAAALQALGGRGTSGGTAPGSAPSSSPAPRTDPSVPPIGAQVLVAAAGGTGDPAGWSPGTVREIARLMSQRSGPVVFPPRDALAQVPVAGCDVGYPDTRPPSPAACQVLDGPGPTVVLVGDSHALDWAPAVVSWARSHGYALAVYSKPNCPLTTSTVLAPARPGPYPECSAWNEWLLDHLVRTEPALVIDSARSGSWYAPVVDGSTVTGSAAIPRLQEVYAATLGRLRAAGVPVVVVRDNPRGPQWASKCLEAHPREWTACSFPASSGIQPDPLARAAQAAGLGVVDLNGWMCVAGRCPQIAGGVTIYRDDSHLTETWVQTLRGPFATALDAVSPLD
ncbi:MAG TPA: acyltransferase family protein [Motilibacteraceae bacterium]|nr:acyltransferase family protein [Motilibacteraceae bacterium]